MAKIIKFDTEARSKMLTGVNTLANAVKNLFKFRIFSASSFRPITSKGELRKSSS